MCAGVCFLAAVPLKCQSEALHVSIYIKEQHNVEQKTNELMYRSVFKEQFLHASSLKSNRHQGKKSGEVSDINTKDREGQKMSLADREREIDGGETNFKRQCLCCPTFCKTFFESVRKRDGKRKSQRGAEKPI